MSDSELILEKSPSGIFLPYQNTWINDHSAVRLYEKSRRIGISWATAGEAVLTAASVDNAGGMDVWYLGYNKEMAQEFIRDAGEWAKKFSFTADVFGQETLKDERDILNYGIKFASGFRITALSSKPNNLRGKQGYVIIDEAAFHDDLEELIKAAMALLIWGGKVAIISTHDGVDNPFNQLCEDIKAQRKPYSLHTTTFMGAISQGLYQRICKVKGSDWSQQSQEQWVAEQYAFYGTDAAEELDVIPSNSGGAVLSRALLELRAIEVPVIRLNKTDNFAEIPEHIRRADIAEWCQSELLPVLTLLDPF